MDRIRVGGWLMIPDSLVVEAAGRAGFDWVGVDLQHGGFDLRTAFDAIQLLDVLNVPVLVRIGEDDVAAAPRVLDYGAAGVIVAMTSSAATIEQVIERAQYPPRGRRSYGGARFPATGRAAHDLRPAAIYAMIEDRAGLDALDAIARTPLLRGLHVGPMDLALSLGVRPSLDDPGWASAVDSIRAAAAAAGLPATMHAVTLADAPEWFARGWSEVVAPADVALLWKAFRSQSPAVSDPAD